MKKNEEGFVYVHEGHFYLTCQECHTVMNIDDKLKGVTNDAMINEHFRNSIIFGCTGCSRIHAVRDYQYRWFVTQLESRLWEDVTRDSFIMRGLIRCTQCGELEEELYYVEKELYHLVGPMCNTCKTSFYEDLFGGYGEGHVREIKYFHDIDNHPVVYDMNVDEYYAYCVHCHLYRKVPNSTIEHVKEVKDHFYVCPHCNKLSFLTLTNDGRSFCSKTDSQIMEENEEEYGIE